MTTTASILRSWPYQPGEAVYYTAYTSFKHPYTWSAATVQRVANRVLDDSRVEVGARVTIQHADGRRATVKACSLVYRGYCTACQLPAHDQAGQLFCARCGQTAVDEPPGDRLAAHLYGREELRSVQKTREAILTGCTMGDAYEPVEVRFNAAYQRMAQLCGLEHGYERFRWPFTTAEIFGPFEHLSLMENVEAAKAIVDGVIAQEAEKLKTTIRFIQRMPPVDGDEFGPRWAPPQSDQQPDGADDITLWLERKMQRKAA
jgi:hypothetical protein